MESDTSDTYPVPTSPHLDEACRILTVSSSLSAASSFIERLKSLSSSSTPPSPSTSTPTSESVNIPTSSVTPHQASKVPITIPYTISNRYYAADVHFAAYPLSTVSPSLFSNGDADLSQTKVPPAVIFVWADGEPYAKHVEELSRMMALGGYEPEVCLAVRIPKFEAYDVPDESKNERTATGNDTSETDEDDDNADIDSTLMSFGFEYVDAARETRRSRNRVSSQQVHSEYLDEGDADIPRLPRVLDALSTIMWPSMRAANAKRKASQKASSSSTPLSPAQIQARKERQQERDSIMEELLAVTEISGLDGRWKGTVLVGEVEEVGDGEEEEEGELGEEVVFSPYDFGRASGSGSMGFGMGRRETKTKTRNGNEARPWLVAGARTGPLNLPSGFPAGDESGEGGGMVSSPTDIEALSPFGVGGASEDSVKGKNISIGFEDDFTAFVSAPALPAAGTARQPQLNKEGTPFGLDLSKAGFEDHDDGDMVTPLQTAVAESVGTGNSLRVERGTGLGHDLHAHAYRSLGSVSDFGGSDIDVDERKGYEALSEDADGWGNKEEEEEEWEDAVDEDDGGEEGFEDAGEIESWGDEEEEGLPTKEEIRETAVKIFGGVPTSHGSGSKTKSREKDKPELGASFERASDLLKERDGKELSEMTERMRRLGGMTAAADVNAGLAAVKENAKAKGASSTSASGTRGTLPEPVIEDDREDDGPPAAFDLERVLHSLQAFRSEISGMEDEDEKRRMAARVALGLVYGLEGIDDDEVDDA